MLISVGTGTAPTGDPKVDRKGRPVMRLAKRTPAEMMSSMSQEQDLNCRAIGRCVFGHPIDRELGNMVIEQSEKSNRAFVYARFDPQVGDLALQNLETKIPVNSNHFKKMNEPKFILEIRAVGEACLLYTSPSPRDRTRSRMPSSA